MSTKRLTRKTWTAYCFPTLVAAVLIGLLTVRVTGKLRYLSAPVPVLLLWSVLAVKTPREGIATETIRSTPGACVMLASGALAFGAMGALFLIDSLCFENRFGSPIGLYELAIVGPPFVIMFGGAYWADRIKKTAEKHVSSP